MSESKEDWLLRFGREYRERKENRPEEIEGLPFVMKNCGEATLDLANDTKSKKKFKFFIDMCHLNENQGKTMNDFLKETKNEITAKTGVLEIGIKEIVRMVE